ncbi:uncharacterized protein BO95DRAFT_199401 [Aspergillus brunneoviolaceus CBS 621.78]|uniref:Uncharacterized protein n=1 Tax=Aspergillus brunneoviolaceus CBS 621.78 TaxID=1450534 RepID=A0ACD1G3S3_9EURO|nr:hypothetical protein BO95DRAFT_199401 [Aspergillus brunneoviolaceus CBS 621.78]RAH43818.1 hypothetical protein BO95DRAFT_199401 [Aspergillus brunneoviolaceus CBS 621.78]
MNGRPFVGLSMPRVALIRTRLAASRRSTSRVAEPGARLPFPGLRHPRFFSGCFGERKRWGAFVWWAQLFSGAAFYPSIPSLTGAAQAFRNLVVAMVAPYLACTILSRIHQIPATGYLSGWFLHGLLVLAGDFVPFFALSPISPR